MPSTLCGGMGVTTTATRMGPLTTMMGRVGVFISATLGVRVEGHIWGPAGACLGDREALDGNVVNLANEILWFTNGSSMFLR